MEARIRLIALRSKAERLRERIKTLIDEITKERKKVTRFYEDINRLQGVFDAYNDMLSSCEKFKELKDVTDLLPHISTTILTTFPYGICDEEGFDKVLSSLETAEDGCFVIINALNSLLMPEVSPRDIDKLSSLKSVIEEVESRLKTEYMYLVDDVKEAIREYEEGHYLAAALIVSRVICFTLEQFQGKNDEEKLNVLIDKGIIEKSRKDEQQTFLRASKLSRNLLSHKPYLRPKTEEALTLISSAITFCRYLAKLAS